MCICCFHVNIVDRKRLVSAMLKLLFMFAKSLQKVDKFPNIAIFQIHADYFKEIMLNP